MVGDHINGQSRSFQIMAPIRESLEDREQFFVVGVIIEFGFGECAWMVCYRVYFSIGKGDWEDCPNGIIRRIGFEGNLSIGYPMSKYRSRKKSSFVMNQNISIALLLFLISIMDLSICFPPNYYNYPFCTTKYGLMIFSHSTQLDSHCT